jgi:hypothetical protein
MQTQTQTLLQILYRSEKGALAMIEKSFASAPMEKTVAAVYEQKRANVAELEKQLGKKAAS